MVTSEVREVRTTRPRRRTVTSSEISITSWSLWVISTMVRPSEAMRGGEGS